MARVSPATIRLVWVKAGGLCSYPGCRLRLVTAASPFDPEAMIGEVAHIIAHSGEGPRANASEIANRDAESNLMLLCPTHHAEIDAQYDTWTVERLRGVKLNHEGWVQERLGGEHSSESSLANCGEVLHSSLLPVSRIPKYVFTVPCEFDEARIRQLMLPPKDREIALPFIVREKKLITFTDLTRDGVPFQVLSRSGAVERFEASAWWADPDLSKWYVALLNRALNKLTGRRGLNLDKEHRRYYFDPDSNDDGSQTRTVRYQPLNRPTSTKKVVWQPTRRRTGEVRKFWVHLAVALRFHRVSGTSWVLSIRPERRFTIDGWSSLPSDVIGARATSAKAHMYNYALLAELQFWKDFLADGKPHIILQFGGQSLVINAELLSGDVEWPGVPGDAKPYENVLRPTDLFSSAAYLRAVASDKSPDAELSTWEVEDLIQLDGSVLPDEFSSL